MSSFSKFELSPEEYATLVRTDLMAFIEAAFYELHSSEVFVPGAYLEVITTYLEKCRTREIRRLIINLPPRSLKSHCVSVAFVAWLLGHDPGARIICASYGQDLADNLARHTRMVMLSPWYQTLFLTRLSDHQAVRDFDTTEMGCRMATSVGGVLTGRGGRFIIIDDPIKPDEALSDSQRKAANDWFDNTLLSRLDDKEKGCIIIVMQRLHEDDLVGHVLEQENWTVLSFPAIAEVDSVHRIESAFGSRLFVRKAGTALHPERESLETLRGIRSQIGEYNFASQYQQTPVPPGGNIVKSDWLRYYEPGSEPPRHRCTLIAQSWDTANKASEISDYSVCTTWAVVGRNEVYLLDVFRKRLNFPELKRAVIELRSRYQPQRILIEDKASGTQLIQELKREGHNVTPYVPPAGNDKQMRLFAQTTWFENGHVHLPSEAPWLRDYVAELTGFPGSKHDDQVDSTTQFLDELGKRPHIDWAKIAAAMRRPMHRPLLVPSFYFPGR